MAIGATTYNEFDEADKAKIDQLAQRLAAKHKYWLEREMKKFRDARTLVFIGRAMRYSAGTGTLTVSVDMQGSETTLALKGVPPKDGNAAKGKAVRVLYDTRTKSAYYDDIYV